MKIKNQLLNQIHHQFHQKLYQMGSLIKKYKFNKKDFKKIKHLLIIWNIRYKEIKNGITMNNNAEIQW